MTEQTYIEWLHERSMLAGATKLSAKFTGSGAMWILILPISAQSLSRSWWFTAVVSLLLLGLIWRAFFPN